LTERKVCDSPEFHPNLCRCLPRGMRMVACPTCRALVRERDLPRHVEWHVDR
jgi:hypothetical protein